MPRKSKKLTLNLDVAWDSAVYGLQLAYTAYKKAVQEELGWTWVDTEGHISILDGYKNRHKKTQDAEAEVMRMMQIVQELRDMRGKSDG